MRAIRQHKQNVGSDVQTSEPMNIIPPFPRLIALILALTVFGCAGPHPDEAGNRSVQSGHRLTVRTTAYTHTEPGGIVNGVGGRLRFKSSVRSAAADWSWMPLGTRFRIAGSAQEYVIEDYGSALVGKKTIDLYFPTRSQMNEWGVRHVEIEILEWGSKQMSLFMLNERQRHDHVRQMVAELRRQGVQLKSKSPG